MKEKSSIVYSKPASLVFGVMLGAAGLGIAHTTGKTANNPPATLKMA